MRRYMLLLVALTTLWPVLARTTSAATTAPAFVRRWARDDAAVASGDEQRSWTWGPLVVRSGAEPYSESPGGQRDVWYLDKARMELTHPEADADDEWYVSSGLLVKEMISGEMQLGDNEWERWQPATVPVAGDLEAPVDQTITYADLGPLAASGVEKQDGAQLISDVLAPGGTITQSEELAAHGMQTGAYDEITRHNVAAVFLDALPAERLLYIAGRPLTEPYWARVPVGREPRDVLLQAFERRVLTYTPSNPDGWKVEWGNVGAQYALWRHGPSEQGALFEPLSTVDASVAARELRELAPTAAEIALARDGLVGAAVFQLDTGALYSFQGTRAFPMYSTAKVPIMLAVLDQAARENRRVTAWEQDRIEIMIKVSDNAAASQLLQHAGGAAAVEKFLRSIGIRNTRINDYTWGSSTTTAPDMARLMAKLGDCTILVPRLCSYAIETMQNVAGGQKWGVSAGVPASGLVALKNGWYPQRNGWGINSIGLVVNGGKRYTIAVFTNPNPSKEYGVETIERISSEVYPAVP